ncbi:hypothetical protein EN817_28225 [Mesorhizobium sp. M3A.F.Ca.ET.174.01.1.1]|uniref:hypothetical protein n=1 Tax=unclassified Mesorhizobium TaxID=325217 RepID=UPI001093BFCC|nr:MULTISPECIES: hypothetical protein [unclassified Mesorhizobium]TGS71566.1 hypothetical protein EN844_00755 [Mesorhizobium sp. M3A.F.Ca.ET.201.01.1.1]TGS82425.1 hypothetical protein EN818_27675 [Mesorhizobium sp. M3A.F.Ca.ET.175.01.1.1]TGT22247.1 hypothetical protein EN817_28225 [Mesorhizobium sp. M3A.F.Ca.ET.174.01.1.1]
MHAETNLEMGERHVREGKARIARQRELIEELSRDGHPTKTAEKVLQKFEAVQEQLEAHLHFLKNSN